MELRINRVRINRARPVLIKEFGWALLQSQVRSPLSATPIDLLADNMAERFPTYVYMSVTFSLTLIELRVFIIGKMQLLRIE